MKDCERELDQIKQSQDRLFDTLKENTDDNKRLEEKIKAILEHLHLKKGISYRSPKVSIVNGLKEKLEEDKKEMEELKRKYQGIKSVDSLKSIKSGSRKKKGKKKSKRKTVKKKKTIKRKKTRKKKVNQRGGFVPCIPCMGSMISGLGILGAGTAAAGTAVAISSKKSEKIVDGKISREEEFESKVKSGKGKKEKKKKYSVKQSDKNVTYKEGKKTVKKKFKSIALANKYYDKMINKCKKECSNK